jgi:PKD repeat protein
MWVVWVIDMERDNLIQIVTLIIAVVALILAVFSVAVPGDDEEKEDEPENETPTAIISVGSTSVEEMENVLFDASVSTDSDGTIVECTWDFGDGGKDSGMYTNHAYSAANTYTVILTIIDNDGATDDTTFSMNVTEPVVPDNNPPVALFIISDTIVEEYTYINLNGSASYDSDGTIAEYTWDLGDGTKDSGRYSSHFYSSTGTFTVVLTVVDNEGMTNMTSLEITVTEGGGPLPNYPPEAEIYASKTNIIIGNSIDFNASESTDSDGTIVEYTWDFGDGTHDSGMRVTYDYLNYGSFNVTLEVVDEDGAKDTQVITIIVTPQTPRGSLRFDEVELGKFEGYFIDEINPTYFSEVEMIIIDDSQSQSASQDPMNPDTTLQILGGLNCTYDDENSNGMINEFETITIYDGDINDVIRFVFKPTGGVIAEYTLLTDAPTGALSFSQGSPGNYTGGFISLSKAVLLPRVKMNITDESLALSIEQEPIDSGVTLQVPGGINITYTDTNVNGKIDAGDPISLKGAAAGDVIKFIYIPTGQVIAQFIIA